MITLTKGPLSVMLRNPSWGDSQVVNPNRIVRHTRAGYIRRARPTDWDTIKIFTYDFDILSDTVKDALREFLILTAADEITIARSGDDITWSKTGYIISPVNEIITVGRSCLFHASFEFQEKIP